MNGNLDKKNGFLYAKAAVAALCGAFTAAFGWLGWLVLAWAACMALGWLSRRQQRGRRQQGRVVQRGSPRGDLAQSRHGGGRLRSGADRLGFKRGGGKPAGVWG